jgi:protein-S-isoprenylcysteine O-methyltransferase Ste14
VQINVLGQQCAVVQPQAIAARKIAAHGGEFQLEFAVFVPRALNPRAVNHAVFAKQFAGFTPLAADAVQQAVLIGFFGLQHAVLVPDTDNAMPATVAQWHHFTKLPITVESFINGLFQYASAILFNTNPKSTPIATENTA